jgi:hypothetical protein
VADDTLQLQLGAPTAQHRAVPAITTVTPALTAHRAAEPRPARGPARAATGRPRPSLAVRRAVFGLVVAVVLAAAVLAATAAGLISRGATNPGANGPGAVSRSSSARGVLTAVSTTSSGATYNVSAGAHQLVVSSRTSCWVEVSQGGRTLFAAVMPPGGSQTFGLTGATTVQLGSAGGSLTVKGGGRSRRLAPPAAPYSFVLRS